ncbi:MAG: LapA family protein [Candidatus Marinimicrobia bacterium]|nr:LapA family protein [Candidatus Neomarinimicrobiota bacterium]
MKILKLIIYIIVIFLILIFVIQNLGQPISIVFFSKSHPLKSEMIIVLLITFIIGIMLGLAFSTLSIIALKARIKTLTAENKKLKVELDRYRNKEINQVVETDGINEE